MKRSSLKRTSMPRRNRHGQKPSGPKNEQVRELHILNVQVCVKNFKAECSWQALCQHPECEKPRAAWEAHHCVYEQHIKDYTEDPTILWHPDNALRLCKTCHKEKQHARKSPVPVSALRTENFEFAERLMGAPAAYEYFRRYYRGTDPRLEAFVEPGTHG